MVNTAESTTEGPAAYPPARTTGMCHRPRITPPARIERGTPSSTRRVSMYSHQPMSSPAVRTKDGTRSGDARKDQPITSSMIGEALPSEGWPNLWPGRSSRRRSRQRAYDGRGDQDQPDGAPPAAPPEALPLGHPRGHVGQLHHLSALVREDTYDVVYPRVSGRSTSKPTSMVARCVIYAPYILHPSSS